MPFLNGANLTFPNNSFPSPIFNGRNNPIPKTFLNGAPAPSGVTKGCVLFLPFWDKKGLTSDSSNIISSDIYRHRCTVNGPTCNYRGRTFVANDNYISVPKSAPINSLTELTVRAWISPTGLADRFIDKDAWGFRITAGNKLQVVVYKDGAGTNAQSIDAIALSMNVYTYVVFTYSNSGDRKIYFYRNGEETSSYDTQIAMSGTLKDDAASNIIIGTDAGYTDDYGGGIGEVGIDNLVLSALEIRRKYLLTKWRYQ